MDISVIGVTIFLKTKQLIATLQLAKVQSEETERSKRLPIGGTKRLLPYAKIFCMGFLRMENEQCFYATLHSIKVITNCNVAKDGWCHRKRK